MQPLRPFDALAVQVGAVRGLEVVKENAVGASVDPAVLPGDGVADVVGNYYFGPGLPANADRVEDEFALLGGATGAADANAQAHAVLRTCQRHAAGTGSVVRVESRTRAARGGDNRDCVGYGS